MRRALSFTLALVLFAQTALASRAESTFWNERRQSLARAATPPTSPPPIKAPFPLARPATDLFPSGPFAGVRLDRFGTVQDAFVPGPATDRPPVFFLLDVHANPDAQRNLSNLIVEISSAAGRMMLAVEGAWGDVPTAPFHEEPRRFVRQAADDLLHAGHIAGPLHAAIHAPGDVTVVGIDDETAYRANVAAYRDSLTARPAARSTLARRLEAFDRLKQERLPARVRAFDKVVNAYAAGETTVAVLAAALARAGARHPAILDFLEAARLEKSLDLDAVERERSRALGALASRLEPRELESLAAWSHQRARGAVSLNAFHRYLSYLFDRAGMNLERMPALSAYLSYVDAVDRIDTSSLFSALDEEIDAAYRRLAPEGAHRRLIDASRYIGLAIKLTAFSLTKSEWRRYRSLKGSAGNKSADVADRLAPFEEFYRNADSRDHLMATALLSAAAADRPDRIVLVGGGYHASGIRRRLIQAGYPVLTIAPKISRVSVGGATAYLGVFAREKGPLDRLFKDRRLFLAPPVATPGQRTMIALLAVMKEAFAGDPFSPADRFSRLVTPVRVELERLSVSHDAAVGALRRPDFGSAVGFFASRKAGGADLAFSDDRPQTSAVWERFLNVSPLAAIRRVGPMGETAVAALSATVTHTILLSSGSVPFLDAACWAIAAGQLAYFSLHLFGIYIAMDAEPRWAYPWRLPRFGDFIGETLIGSLRFHFLFYLALGVFPYAVDAFAAAFALAAPGAMPAAGFFAVSFLWIATTGFFGLRWAVNAHERNNQFILSGLQNRDRAFREKVDYAEEQFRNGSRLHQILSSNDLPTIPEIDRLIAVASENVLTGLLRLTAHAKEFPRYRIGVISRPGTSEGARGLAIAEMNDLLSPTKNDDVIAAHNEILLEILEAANAEYPGDGIAFLPLGYNYNSFIFAVRENGIPADFSWLADRIRKKIVAYINDKADLQERIRKAVSSRRIANVEVADDGRLLNLPYTVNWGLSDAHEFHAGDSPILGIVSAYAEAVSGMNAARAESDAVDSPAFDAGSLYALLDEVYREGGILDNLRTIPGLIHGAPATPRIDETILAAVRKKPRADAIAEIAGRFGLSAAEADAVYGRVWAYYKRLRALDFTTPWVSSSERETVIEKARRIGHAIDWLRTLRDEWPDLHKKTKWSDYPHESAAEQTLRAMWNETRVRLQRDLATDARAPSLGSRARFFGPAKATTSTYIAIDVERFGAMIFEDLEEAAQNLYRRADRESPRVPADAFSKEMLAMGERTLAKRTAFFVAARRHMETEAAAMADSAAWWRRALEAVRAGLAETRAWILDASVDPDAPLVLNYAGGDEIFLRVPSELVGLRTSVRLAEDGRYATVVEINPVLEPLFELAARHGLIIRVGVSSEDRYAPRAMPTRAAVPFQKSGEGHDEAKKAKKRTPDSADLHSIAIEPLAGGWIAHAQKAGEPVLPKGGYRQSEHRIDPGPEMREGPTSFRRSAESGEDEPKSGPTDFATFLPFIAGLSSANRLESGLSAPFGWVLAAAAIVLLPALMIAARARIDRRRGIERGVDAPRGDALYGLNGLTADLTDGTTATRPLDTVLREEAKAIHAVPLVILSRGAFAGESALSGLVRSVERGRRGDEAVFVVSNAEQVRRLIASGVGADRILRSPEAYARDGARWRVDVESVESALNERQRGRKYRWLIVVDHRIDLSINPAMAGLSRLAQSAVVMINEALEALPVKMMDTGAYIRAARLLGRQA